MPKNFPLLGFGTMESSEKCANDMHKAVVNALDAGYQHFGACTRDPLCLSLLAYFMSIFTFMCTDTAENYLSAPFVGKAIAEHLQNNGHDERNQLFITSKLEGAVDPSCLSAFLFFSSTLIDFSFQGCRLENILPLRTV